MRVVFLPGASGRRSYWQPVASRLCLGNDAILLGWPGFDDVSADSSVRCLGDLVPYALREADGPIDVVAQSMGGVVAILLALQHPEFVRRLVLCGTSGGIDMSRFETEGWRDGYIGEMPETAPRWFVDDRTDVTDEIGSIKAETLLLWGEDDRTSPPGVGRYLADLLPFADMRVIPGAGHMVAEEKPDEVAAHVRGFFAKL
jgi:pimeloyl-ACP methyl ester carboxylesterase